MRALAWPAAAIVAVLALVACGPAALAPTALPDGTQRVELHSGHVARYAVPVGSQVELVVTSDVADRVHVHGYDRSSYVTAGASTTIRFVADRPGVYEVELEGSGEQLGQLAVS